MAVNVSVYDLVNYPDNSKTVAVDIKQVTPIGYEGDEQWVISVTTSAYSDVDNRTAIQDIYIQNQRAGWAKSSGFESAPFNLTSSDNKLRLRLDGDIPSGTDLQIVSGYWEITLDEGDALSGDAIADDMEEKIRALADSADMAAEYMLAYLNASVIFEDNKFKIVSGSVSEFFSGTDRSAVEFLRTTFSDTANTVLGFDLTLHSEDLYVALSDYFKETKTTALYTSPATDLAVDFASGTTTISGVFYIQDKVDPENKYEYFLADTGSTDTIIKVRTPSGAQLANSYAQGSRVQKVAWGDVD